MVNNIMDFFHDKVRGTWFGKCLAGAIGMPYEGVPYTVNISEDDICLSDVPNDDLELQLVWMDLLKRKGCAMQYEDLAELWLNKICHGCDEYSIAIHNMQNNFMPPASGWKNNFFASGMGATIRSEIWALVFAGRPDAAAHFARMDAECDHWGDGVRGEIFMANAEAHACMNSDIKAALEFAFEQIGDKECRLYRELAKVFDRYNNNMSEADARNEILLSIQRHQNFTDCVMNLCFIVHALLYGEGDFLKTVLLTISFGRDTDCTAATCGAFLGIASGMKVFPEKWLDKVNEKLSLSSFVTSIPGVPLTLTDLVDQTLALREKLLTELPENPYPAYEPYQPVPGLPQLDHSRWLIIDENRHDSEEIKRTLLKTGCCPEELKQFVVDFDTLFMDISQYTNQAGKLHLFSFLTVNNHDVRPENIVCSATADAGMRMWMDDRRLMNHHSRQKMLPSFHRAEGGGAFALPLAAGSRHLFHLELFSCLPPLRVCVMFGNTFNDHLDGFDFDI